MTTTKKLARDGYPGETHVLGIVVSPSGKEFSAGGYKMKFEIMIHSPGSDGVAYTVEAADIHAAKVEARKIAGLHIIPAKIRISAPDNDYCLCEAVLDGGRFRGFRWI